MIEFNQPVKNYLNFQGESIPSFLGNESNIDWETVKSFGEEWTKFSSFDSSEIEKIGNDYFDILPNDPKIKNWRVLDVGCGTGRWTRYLAEKVGFVECVDPSEAVYSATKLLKDKKNVRIIQAGVDNIPFPDQSFDLVFSLGVLHHIPNTPNAIKDCVKKVKKGGYFLVYLYYSLDNRGMAYKALFWLSNLFRMVISALPSTFKKAVCDLIAVLVYLPFALFARLLSNIGLKKISHNIPLAYYQDKSFNVIRNDALDRFGTPLEQRFSRAQITTMLKDAELTNIRFSETAPYWHAIGQKL